MLKFTQLLCAAALALGSTTAMAQTVSPTAVDSPDNLTDGYYVIKATSNDGTRGGGYVYYNPNGGDNRRFRVGGSGTSYGEGETADLQYVWKLTNNDNPSGTFTLQNAEYDNTFIPADSEHNQNFRGTETANLKVEVCEEEGDRNGRWYITMENYQHSGQNTYWCLNAPNSGDANLSYWEGQANDAVVYVQFYPVTMPDEIAYDADYAAAVAANLAKTGVGYPVNGSSVRQLLNDALTAYNAEGEDDQMVAIETYNSLRSAYNDYLLSSPVQMPEDGKAYTLTFVGSDANQSEYYLNYDATNDQIVAVSRPADSELPESARFIARQQEDGRFMFALPSGKYFVWKGGSGGTNSNKGVIDAYDETFAALTVEHARSNNGSHMTSATAENIFGTFTIWGVRSNGSQTGYFLLNNNGTFNHADQPFYDGSITSCFRIEEAPAYLNTVTMNTAGDYAYSTAYLPFAVDVPEGVEAFTGAVDGEELALTSIEDGVIPARTAVVLRGTTAGSLALAPSTAAGTAAADNALQGTLEADQSTPENTYVLSAFDGEAGFYKYTAATLPVGKAYLTLPAGTNVQKLSFSFGGQTTGIQGVQPAGEEKAATWYDLSGRRVTQPTKGIYIVNGKKVVLK